MDFDFTEQQLMKYVCLQIMVCGVARQQVSQANTGLTVSPQYSGTTVAAELKQRWLATSSGS